MTVLSISLPSGLFLMRSISLSSTHHFVSTVSSSLVAILCFGELSLYRFCEVKTLWDISTDESIPCFATTVPLPVGEASSTATVDVNHAYRLWIQQDQGILSMIISSLTEEVMPLVLGRHTSMAAWRAIELVLASSSRARTVYFLTQLQTLQHG